MKVRLTEQQLKNIISESVKQVLTELDWQTYLNASRKRKQQANHLGDEFLDKKGRSKEDMLKKSKDLLRYTGDVFDRQYNINDYAPESDDELGQNLDNAALDYMLYDTDNPSVNRRWDPYTKKYERNGMDMVRRRYNENKDYRDDLDANFKSARELVSDYNDDGEELGFSYEKGDIFDDDWYNPRAEQFYGF